ncbi:MAG TPA: DNA methyltransferase, partial [Candidatus Cloacimonadota bacterium]|nr:DNA methyltransferase [Candidatus Cloacimonadota bacterium]
RFWIPTKNTLQKHIDEGRICFKKEHKENERGFIYKRYLKDLKTTQNTLDSLVFTQNEFMNQSATKELKSLGLVEYFLYPKGVNFIRTLITHTTNENDLILDFFSGSSTTAHAVMQINAEDGG